MGRFEHLELGDWQAEHPDQPPEDGRPVDQSYYLDKARDAFEGENYERALTYFSRALEYDPDIEEAWVGQIRSLIELGQLQEAVTWTNRALERLPDSPEVLSVRAVAESRLGRSASAIGYSDGALSEQRCTPYCWVARGEVLIRLNDESAKACFVKAVEMAPSEWAVRAWIARAYLVRGCWHQALQHLRAAVQLDPDRFTSWYWIGRCCEALGETEDARRAYGRALAAEPRFSRAREAIERLDTRNPALRLIDAVRRAFRRRL